MVEPKSSKINPVETVYVNTRLVSCNGSREGNSSVFGHPTSYLNMGKSDNVTCPYCGRNFKLRSKK